MNQVNPKTICLLYTAYHSFIWDLIRENYPTKETITINFSKRLTKKPNQTIERSRLSNIEFLRKCVGIAIESKFIEYNLILPHPDHLLGNFLFFGKRLKKLTILEDGILNYYNYQASGEIKKKAQKRRLITFLSPFRYKFYHGHHSGIEVHNKKEIYGWFSDPESVVHKEKFKSIKKIDFKNSLPLSPSTQSHAILLDQPLETFLSKELAQKIRNRSTDYLTKNFPLITIKPHPQHKTTYIPANSKLLHQEQYATIEEIIAIHQPIAVISYCSSALLNIKKIFPDIKCVSIGMKEITEEKPILSKILNLYKTNDIEII